MSLSFLHLSTLPLVLALPQDETFVSKREVEAPVERALDLAGPVTSLPARPVPPGLVRWHADLASACAAAEQSRKPVLLFQLLGRLDEELC